MQPKWAISAQRRRRSRGDTIMELAFFILPTFAILCGFFDLGMALFTWNTLQNAVREGTRYAITYQVDSSNSQTSSIKAVVAKWSMGFVSATAVAGQNVPYVDVQFYSQPSTTNLTGTNVTANSNANAVGNLVEVSIKSYPYTWLMPFSGSFSGPFFASPGSTLGINVYSTDLLGGSPPGGTPPK